ncbi:MFS transporter [Flavisphingomonas formosensis]|uniref:MFS transporter n=1 Tax=Flavisphingomonas formosensis TaxID=861534 RepID=UPI0012F97B45|nr:MFS transporter [Sphingomonas formosensis]
MARTGRTDPDGTARLTSVAGCFLAQNFVMGTAYGSFGPLLTTMQADLGIGRAVASMGMSVVTLALALVAAAAGGVMQRFRTRDVMIVGVAVSAIAYLGLALTPSFVVALVSYALVGIGIALGAILAPLALTTRWVSDGRGKALAIVNLPVVLFTCPFVIGEVLPEIGRRAVLLALSAALLMLIPVLLALVRERPSGESGFGGQGAAGTPAEPVPAGAIVANSGFWFVSLGIGLMAGCGIIFVVHIVPFGTSAGLSLGSATALLSIYAGAGLLGTPLFGWLADRLGPPIALILSGGVQALGWALLLVVKGPALLLVAATLGVCCTPLVTLHGAALTALFGHATVARAMGYSYLCKLPFIFGFGPMAGAMFDATGDYRMPFLLCSALMACATLCFLALSVVSRQPGDARTATA